jgi:hypothetical protein
MTGCEPNRQLRLTRAPPTLSGLTAVGRVRRCRLVVSYLQPPRRVRPCRLVVSYLQPPATARPYPLPPLGAEVTRELRSPTPRQCRLIQPGLLLRFLHQKMASEAGYVTCFSRSSDRPSVRLRSCKS